MGSVKFSSLRHISNITLQYKPERYVLHASRAVIVHILLDLGLLLSGRGLIDRHLDRLLEVGDHDGPQGRVVGVDLRVVHRPEPVEHQVALVPGGRVLHGQVGLVPHDVVNVVDVGGGQLGQQHVLVRVRFVSSKEKH